MSIQRICMRSLVLMCLGFFAVASQAPLADAQPQPGDVFVREDQVRDESPEAVIFSAFRAGFKADFGAYLELIHPDERQTRKQISDRKRYEWDRFQRHLTWYLEQSRSGVLAFYVARVQKHDNQSLRFFLRDLIHEGRMPTPILLKRYEGRWTIVVSSL